LPPGWYDIGEIPESAITAGFVFYPADALPEKELPISSEEVIPVNPPEESIHEDTTQPEIIYNPHNEGAF
jgi:hypothetical protein